VITNWRAYSADLRQKRHQEYKNYIKSLYQAASCLLQTTPRQALVLIKDCIQADQDKNYLSEVNKYFALGKVHFYLNELEPARLALETSATLANPANDDYVFELLGRVHLLARNAVKAYEIIHKVPFKRRRPYYLWTEADILVALGRSDEAKRLLMAAAEKDRLGKHKALIRLARLEFCEDNFQACLQHCLNANRFFQSKYQNPCSDAMFWTSAAQFKLGRLSDSQKILDELQAFRPGYPHLGRLKALVIG
jgi:hypothetical protein